METPCGAASFEVRPSEGAMLVVMRGDFDLATRLDFDAALQDLLTDPPAAVLLDMGQVRFIDSQWVALLVLLYRQVVERREGQMRVVAASSVARRLLTLCGVAAFEGFEIDPEPDRECEDAGT